MKYKIFIVIVVIILTFIALYLYTTNRLNFLKLDNMSNEIKTTVLSDFKLESKYMGNNIWEYTVTGTLPNPCYSATVDTTVAESYPEQVKVTILIQPPDPEIMCTQVIEDFEYSSTFNASEKAVITLEVE